MISIATGYLRCFNSLTGWGWGAYHEALYDTALFQRVPLVTFKQLTGLWLTVILVPYQYQSDLRLINHPETSGT